MAVVIAGRMSLMPLRCALLLTSKDCSMLRTWRISVILLRVQPKTLNLKAKTWVLWNSPFPKDSKLEAPIMCTGKQYLQGYAHCTCLGLSLGLVSILAPNLKPKTRMRDSREAYTPWISEVSPTQAQFGRG